MQYEKMAQKILARRRGERIVDDTVTISREAIMAEMAAKILKRRGVEPEKPKRKGRKK